MAGYDVCQSLCMGKAGELVQVAGYAFELGHEVKMFATQTLAHTTGSDQLAENFGCSMTGGTDKRFQLEVMFGIEP